MFFFGGPLGVRSETQYACKKKIKKDEVFDFLIVREGFSVNWTCFFGTLRKQFFWMLETQ